MKSKNVRSIKTDGERTFEVISAELEKAVVAESPITKKDKKGAKATDAEIGKLDFMIKEALNYGNFLPHDFNMDDVNEKKMIISTKSDQIAILDRITKELKSQITVTRIELKPKVKTIYDAAKKAAANNTTLEYIPKTIGECYKKS